MNYKNKYLKYKLKYLNEKKLYGGSEEVEAEETEPGPSRATPSSSRPSIKYDILMQELQRLVTPTIWISIQNVVDEVSHGNRETLAKLDDISRFNFLKRIQTIAGPQIMANAARQVRSRAYPTSVHTQPRSRPLSYKFSVWMQELEKLVTPAMWNSIQNVVDEVSHGSRRSLAELDKISRDNLFMRIQHIAGLQQVLNAKQKAISIAHPTSVHTHPHSHTDTRSSRIKERRPRGRSSSPGLRSVTPPRLPSDKPSSRSRSRDRSPNRYGSRDISL
jgi:hypothetical protein